MDTEFSPEQSLRLITSMIDKTRKSISDKSYYFLIWGWGTFLACIAQFILKVYFNSPYHYQVWWVIVPCILLSVLAGKRDKHGQQVKTYIGETMGLLWMSLSITFFVMSMIFSKFGWQYCFPFFIMIYGLGTFISGRLLRFTPLVVGGIVCWVLAIISAWIDYDYQILATAMALLVSYIIPGHLLRWNFKKYI